MGGHQDERNLQERRKYAIWTLKCFWGARRQLLIIEVFEIVSCFRGGVKDLTF